MEALGYFVPFMRPFISDDVDNDEEKNEQPPVEESEKSLQTRCITHWRTFPAAISLLACLIGIICAFIWQYPYLAIPFGVGTAASGIAMCLTRELAHLKSMTKQLGDFETQNTVLQESVEKLKASLEASQAQIADFKKNNEAYEEANKELVKNIDEMEGKFKDQVSLLQDENASFKRQVEKLENSRREFDASTALHLGQMEKVRSSLTSAIESADQGQVVFGTKLLELQQALTGIQDVDESIRQNSKEAAGLLERQSQELAATGESIVKLLGKLLDDDKVKKGLEAQEAIHAHSEMLLRQQREVQDRLEILNKESGRIEGSIASLKEFHEKLQKQNEELEASLQRKVKQFEKIDISLEKHEKGIVAASISLEKQKKEIVKASKKVKTVTQFLSQEVSRAEQVVGNTPPTTPTKQTVLGTQDRLIAPLPQKPVKQEN